MAVVAITDNYVGERRDAIENFHGNQVVYIAWDKHLMFCAPLAFALPPETPFNKLTDEIMPGAFSLHPDFEQIDWGNIQWYLNGEAFTPRLEATLAEQGIDHKSIVRFSTPGLDGLKGSGS